MSPKSIRLNIDGMIELLRKDERAIISPDDNGYFGNPFGKSFNLDGGEMGKSDDMVAVGQVIG